MNTLHGGPIDRGDTAWTSRHALSSWNSDPLPEQHPSAIGTSSSAKQAWLREIERAQIANWFQPFQPSPSALHPEVPRTEPWSRHQAVSAVADPGARVGSRLQQSARPSPPPASPMSMPSSLFAALAPSHADVPLPSQVGDGGVPVPTGDSPDLATTQADVAGAGRELVALGDASPRSSAFAASASQDPRSSGARTADAARHQGDETARSTAQTAWLASMPTETQVAQRSVLSPVFSPATVVSVLAQGQAHFTLFRENANPGEEPLREAHSAHAQRRATTAPQIDTAERTCFGQQYHAPSTRLHVQWSGSGLQVWLGMDGTAQQVVTRAQMVAADLERTLRAQGLRLNRVVCNGQVVFDAPSGKRWAEPTAFADLVRPMSSTVSSTTMPSFYVPKEFS